MGWNLRQLLVREKSQQTHKEQMDLFMRFGKIYIYIEKKGMAEL